MVAGRHGDRGHARRDGGRAPLRRGRGHHASLENERAGVSRASVRLPRGGNGPAGLHAGPSSRGDAPDRQPSTGDDGGRAAPHLPGRGWKGSTGAGWWPPARTAGPSRSEGTGFAQNGAPDSSETSDRPARAASDNASAATPDGSPCAASDDAAAQAADEPAAPATHSDSPAHGDLTPGAGDRPDPSRLGAFSLGKCLDCSSIRSIWG